MLFNGGIGIYDVNWCLVFGGNIYRISGFYGCVNLLYFLV